MERFILNETKSKELFERAKNCIPGGVNSPVRAFGAVGRTPLFIKEAKGSHITDEDGNTFIDYVCSWGPGILGHCEPSVIAAVQEACTKGLTYGAPTQNEIILAEMIKECMPSLELVRLVNSGTEAVMSAIRVARGYTKRDKIIKFKGCYHGHSDGLLVKAGSAALTNAVPDSAGVPSSYTEQTLIALYNDESSVAELFDKYKDQIAAVVVEPVAANMGVVLPKEGFLSFLRDITEKNGALLIFDEVITGFRLGLSGAQGYYGIKPDLTTLGKIIGGGMPLAAYGGRRDIMEKVAPLGAVYQAGTLSGNPVATTAGIETLKILMEHPEIYDRIEKSTKTIAETARKNKEVCVNQIGSLMSIFFTSKPVVDYDSALTSDTKRYAEYFSYMLEHGIYVAPSQFEAMFISNAHTDKEIKITCDIISDSLEQRHVQDF
jgi:glutamate-1-semialdehyde 2,1-aminomutase